MPHAEYQRWREFYRLYPFDDFHRFHRPAALIAAADAKDQNAAIDSRLKWLLPQQTKHPNEAGWSEAELNSFAAHGMTPPQRG